MTALGATTRLQGLVNASVLDMIGNTPMVDVSVLSPNPRVRILGKMEMQNPFGSVKDRIAKAMIEDAERRGLLAPGPDDPRAVVGQHRYRARGDREHQGLSDQDHDARERVDRTAPDARGVRRRDHPHPGRGGVERRRGPRDRPRGRTSRLVLPVPVRERQQPAGALRRHRARRSGAMSPRSPTSSPGSARAAPSWAPVGT